MRTLAETGGKRLGSSAGRIAISVGVLEPRDASFADRVLMLVDGELHDAEAEGGEVLRGPGIAEADIAAALARYSI